MRAVSRIRKEIARFQSSHTITAASVIVGYEVWLTISVDNPNPTACFGLDLVVDPHSRDRITVIGENHHAATVLPFIEEESHEPT